MNKVVSMVTQFDKKIVLFDLFTATCLSVDSTDLRFIQLVVDGLAIGSLIALGAAGLTLIYGILRLPNFAHGDFITLGAYLTLGFTQLKIPVQFSMPLGVIFAVGIFLGLEKFLWGPMRSKRVVMTTMIIVSIGVALFLRNGIQVIWGSRNQSYGLPLAQPITFFCVKFAFYRLVIMLLAFFVLGALYYLLQKTKMGKAMRAVADNLELARVSGIDVDRVILWTWILAGGLTAISGGLYGLISAIRPNMGWFLILPLFAATILGGIGNPYGAIVGAFTIGITQEVSTLWLPNAYKPAVALIIVMVVLLTRPQGIFRGSIGN